jgi:Diguanylate cyclase, GGDEF domain
VRYAIGVAERISEAMKEPFELDGMEASVTASIGIAVASGRESRPDDLVRNSDRAMYEAKHRGKARFVVFHEGLSGNGTPAGPPAHEEEAEAEPEHAKSVEHAEVLEEEEPAAGGDEIAIHRETIPLEAEEGAPVEGESDVLVESVQAEAGFDPEEGVESTDNGRPEQREPDAAATLSEARRRRRRRFPPS